MPLVLNYLVRYNTLLGYPEGQKLQCFIIEKHPTFASDMFEARKPESGWCNMDFLFMLVGGSPK
jgi:hypothetical protein